MVGWNGEKTPERSQAAVKTQVSTRVAGRCKDLVIISREGQALHDAGGTVSMACYIHDEDEDEDDEIRMMRMMMFLLFLSVSL